MLLIRMSWLAGMLAMLTACGLKGPLRLPEKTAPATVTPAPTPKASNIDQVPPAVSDDKTGEPATKLGPADVVNGK